MKDVLQSLFQFFVYAVLAVFAQNAVFTRALGVSRLTKIVEDGSDSWTLGILLCCVQLISAPLGYWANDLIGAFAYRSAVRPLVMVACSGVAFFLVLGAVVALRSAVNARAAVAALPMATFNTCVLGTLLVSESQNFNFPQTMGFALGSGLGYMLAIQVVAEGKRKLDDQRVPVIFRGLPVTLLYIAILALAIYGFTGHTVSF